MIERIFGVLKRRFPILNRKPEYSYHIQVQLVPTLCALQNFIRVHSPEREIEFWEQEVVERGYGSSLVENESDQEGEIYDDVRMVQVREKIASDMWNDYVAIRAARCHYGTQG